MSERRTPDAPGQEAREKAGPWTSAELTASARESANEEELPAGSPPPADLAERARAAYEAYWGDPPTEPVELAHVQLMVSFAREHEARCASDAERFVRAAGAKAIAEAEAREAFRSGWYHGHHDRGTGGRTIEQAEHDWATAHLDEPAPPPPADAWVHIEAQAKLIAAHPYGAPKPRSARSAGGACDCGDPDCTEATRAVAEVLTIAEAEARGRAEAIERCSPQYLAAVDVIASLLLAQPFGHRREKALTRQPPCLCRWCKAHRMVPATHRLAASLMSQSDRCSERPQGEDSTKGER